MNYLFSDFNHFHIDVITVKERIITATCREFRRNKTSLKKRETQTIL